MRAFYTACRPQRALPLPRLHKAPPASTKAPPVHSTRTHRLGGHHRRQAVKLGEGAGVLRIKEVVDGALQVRRACGSKRW